MSSELSKTISTCAIWIALAVILTFGVFRDSVDGFTTVVLTGIVMLGGTVSSFAVWVPQAFVGKEKVDKLRGFEVVQPAPADELEEV
jgi:preprotein translocase subunit SecF